MSASDFAVPGPGDEFTEFVADCNDRDRAADEAKWARIAEDAGPWSAPDDPEQREMLASLGFDVALPAGMVPHDAGAAVVGLDEAVDCCASGRSAGGPDHCGLCGKLYESPGSSPIG